MKILVINCGSSSIKYQLINMEDEKVIAKGYVQKIGMSDSFVEHKKIGGSLQIDAVKINDHREGFLEIVNILLNKDEVIKDLNEINALGHRIVHGGESFKKPALVDEDVIAKIEMCSPLAPLHNPAHVMGIRAAIEVMPGIPNVTVFDTSYHQAMPKESYMYAIPYEAYEKHKIRRYGFHGTSHEYVVNRLAMLENKNVKDINAIVCHLGNGGSLCAVKNGKSFDTTMGFTPLEGIVMGSRCGDLDPAIIPYLMENEDMTTTQINDYLNKQSGFFGYTGYSDARDVQKLVDEGDEKAKLILDMYCYRIRKYIGAYIAALGCKVDYIAFAGGIGERNSHVREMILDGLDGLGIALDKEINEPIKDLNCKEAVISKQDSKIKAWVILTDEELMIAKQTMLLV